MLDDLKYIHQRDGQDALGTAAKQHTQLTHAYKADLSGVKKPKNIVFAGMGGSAAAAKLVGQWLNISVPLEIWSRYDAPSYVSKDTLLIAASFSGGTEETISAVESAQAAGAQIVVITSGGTLATIAQENDYPLLSLPESDQPRFGTFYNLVALVTILDHIGASKGGLRQLEAAAPFIASAVENWAADIPTSKNPAKQLALELAGTTPIIHAGPKMYPAAHKWKIDLNENAKNVAWTAEIPEFSHNEFIGWTSHPVDKPFSIVDIRSDLENSRVQKRFMVTEQLLSGRRPHPQIVAAQGNNEVEQLLWAATYGMFVSIYVALLNGQNPTPVELVNDMKKLLQ